MPNIRPAENALSHTASADRQIVEDGVALFNAGRFWHCHEALEKVWLRESGDTKTVLQGVILIAAAFHHQSKRHRQGMLSTMQRGFDRLDKLDNVYGIDVMSLRATVRRILNEIEKGPEAWLKVVPPQISQEKG